MKYNKVTSKMPNYIYTSTIVYLLCVIGALIVTNAVINNFFEFKYSYLIYSIILISIIIAILVINILPRIIDINYGYYIDEERLESLSGIIFLNKKIVLLKNIYKVSIKKGLVGGFFGISSLSVYTNAGKVKIYLLDEKAVESLYRKIMNKIEVVYEK